MDIPILFEDEHLLAIDKPAGIVVNNAESVKGETVTDWIRGRTELSVTGEESEADPLNTREFIDKHGIVHRIDKETSGIILIAKTYQAYIGLKTQFQGRTVSKTYLAIVHGSISPAAGTINAPIGRLPWNRMRFGVIPEGRPSETEYERITGFLNLPEEEYSLIKVHPHTGRTHQIRVHMKYLNHPLLGDPLYAGRKTSRDDREFSERLMLHAWQLKAIHPATSAPLEIVAEIPDDMSRFLKRIPAA